MLRKQNVLEKYDNVYTFYAFIVIIKSLCVKHQTIVQKPQRKMKKTNYMFK